MDEFVRISLSPLREAINDLMVRVFAECFTHEDADQNDEETEITTFFPSMQNPALLRELFQDGLITRAALAKAMVPIFNLVEILQVILNAWLCVSPHM